MQANSGKVRWKTAAVVAAIAVLVLALCACSGSGGKNAKDAFDISSQSASSSGESADASGAKANSSSPSAGKNAQAAEALKDAMLSASTEYLEYSSKEVDSNTLVTCDDKDVTVTADEKIDLRELGKQTVTYKLSLDGQSVKRDVAFIVRDTKKPSIKFVEDAPSVDQGEVFDVLANIASVSDEVDGELARVDAAPASDAKDAGLEQFYDEGWFIVEEGVDTSVPGTYAVKVTASDKNGNVASREFAVTVNEVVPAAPAPAANTHTYVLNTNTRKFHVPGCKSVNKMKESNKQVVEMTRDDVVAMGYSPCGNCNP